MKRFLSVICMALLAGGMIFTSCTKQFTITVEANPANAGTVTGGGTFNDQATTVLTATPNAGYQFVKWQDGNTQNPRTITVTATETYVAYFEPAAPAVKVTFNNGVWDASSIQAKYYSDDQSWDVYSMQTQGSLPIADVATGLLSGSATGTAGSNGSLDNESLYWIEYYNETYLQDQSTGYYYGDYWAKNATVAVSAFDATALTLTSNVNATMFSAYEAFVADAGAVGVDAASTAPMTVNMTNIELTAAKGMPSKKVVGKLVAVK